MEKNFTEVRVVHTDHFSKTASFAQFATPKIAKSVLDKVKERKLVLEGFPDVEIKPALTSIDVSRNIFLYKAEELIKGDPNSTGQKVEMKKAKDRGLYVNGVVAFSQRERYDPRGTFEGEFAHLKFP